MNITKLKILFNLNPEAAFNLNPWWVFVYYPYWLKQNKPKIHWNYMCILVGNKTT